MTYWSPDPRLQDPPPRYQPVETPMTDEELDLYLLEKRTPAQKAAAEPERMLP